MPEKNQNEGHSSARNALDSKKLNAEDDPGGLINRLIPFNDLPSGDRLKMARMGLRIKKIAGDILYSSEVQDKVVYLLSGQLDLCYQYLQPQLLSGGSDAALKPVFNEREEPDTHFVVHSDCELWQFDRFLFNRLIEKEVLVDERMLSRQMGHVEINIYNEISQAIESGKLKLPSLPEIALRVRKAIECSDVDIEHVSKIMELDPALSARLIKVANSPLTRGVNPIHKMRDVIVRMGLKVTRSLVMSFSVAQLFKTQHAQLKKQMKIFYSHSIEIASICYALGSRIKTIEPEEALLAGLIHDIGVIPIITYIEKTAFEFDNDEEINRIVKSLRVAVGVLVVKSWELPEEMLNVVSHAEHWHHNSGDVLKVEDIIIVAHIYDLMQRKQLSSLPDIRKVPAFKKIFPDRHDPAFAIEVLDQAKDEINEMKALLGI